MSVLFFNSAATPNFTITNLRWSQMNTSCQFSFATPLLRQTLLWLSHVKSNEHLTSRLCNSAASPKFTITTPRVVKWTLHGNFPLQFRCHAKLYYDCGMCSQSTFMTILFRYIVAVLKLSTLANSTYNQWAKSYDHHDLNTSAQTYFWQVSQTFANVLKYYPLDH